MTEVALWPAPLRALVTGEQVVALTTEPLPDGPLRLVPAGGQRPELCKPAYRRWTDAAGATGVAEVAERWTVRSADGVEAVLGKTVLDGAYAHEALGWTPGTTLHVAALRVHPGTADTPPALSDDMFEARTRGLRDALT